MQPWRLATLLKETPAKVLSCEYDKNSKNTYFEENLQTTACAVPASFFNISIVCLQGPLLGLKSSP